MRFLHVKSSYISNIFQLGMPPEPPGRVCLAPNQINLLLPVQLTTALFEDQKNQQTSLDVKSCSLLELPELFPLNEVSKALLRVQNGPWFICRLLVNFPDYFEQGKYVCLIINFVHI